MFNVLIELGAGSWKVWKIVRIHSGPHVGDSILVGNDVIECHKVWIGQDYIYAFSTMRITAPSQLNDYVQKGWTTSYPLARAGQ